jgi:hypothetical protein
MNARTLGLVLGLALVVAIGVLLRARAPEAPPPLAGEPPAGEAAREGDVRAESGSMETGADEPAEPTAAEPGASSLEEPHSHPAPSGDHRDGEGIAGEKLLREPLSEVPHRVLGAWDERPESPEPGIHRGFTIVVDPSISTGELEVLVRDIRERHRDASVLDVRVFDSEEAVTYDHTGGGFLAGDHLVADVKRNDRIGLDSVKIRGERVPGGYFAQPLSTGSGEDR